MPWETQPDGTEIFVMRTPQERWTYIAAKADWDGDQWALDWIDREVKAQERIERLEAARRLENAEKFWTNHLEAMTREPA